MKKLIFWALALLLALAAASYATYRFTPWPKALLIRHAFDKDAVRANAALSDLVPPGVSAETDVPYLPGDPDAKLDIYRPESASSPLPVLMWIHGGAWISGDKSYLANYSKIIAAEGFAVVQINYSIAPGARYPTPVVQATAALGWIQSAGASHGLDASRIVLAGDSAGSQIAAQTALVQEVPAYAARVGIAPALQPGTIRGLVLHCGGFDLASANLEGAFGDFLRTVFWSYFGTSDFMNDPRAKDFSIPGNLTATFPPLFISAGNADPLEPQSHLVAESAERLGIPRTTLFFPKDHDPPLGHEYQFDLTTEAGKQALAASIAFLKSVLAN